MFYLLTAFIAFQSARLLVNDLFLRDRYPAWRERRLREGRRAGYPAFLILYGSPLFDGAGFLEYMHPDNRHFRRRLALTGLFLFAALFPRLWLLPAIVIAQF